MTSRPPTDDRDDAPSENSSRDPLHLTEGAEPHGEVPVGPQTDVPLLRGSGDGTRSGSDPEEP